jgi:hypothetical protein
VYRKYLALVRKNVRSPGARAACYRQLARWWLTDGHLPDVLRDLLGSHPALRQRARSLKRAVFGDAPRRRSRAACPTSNRARREAPQPPPRERENSAAP